MRAQYALAAVAALGALVYGAADPLNSALTASTRSQDSATAATDAWAAAQVTAKTPRKPKASALSGAALSSSPLNPLRVPVKVAAGPRLTPGPAAPADSGSADLPGALRSLADITASRDKNRAQTARAVQAQQTSPLPSATPVVPQIMVARVVSTQESYGPADRQRVTVSRLSTAKGAQPTVYFVHGGSWIAGGRGEFSAEAERWAARGWTAINIAYRLDVRGNLMLSDVRTVISDFERRPEVDPDRQILVGSSAGAHLAASVAVRSPSEFRGLIAWSPVVSPERAAQGVLPTATGTKLRLAQAARRLWGANWRTASPVSYVTAKTPPLWAAASSGEWLKWSDQGDQLCEALGKRCSSHLVPGREHGAELAQTHPALREQALEWATKEIS